MYLDSMCEVSPAFLVIDMMPKASQFFSYDMTQPIRRSCRIACRADQQGARLSVSSRARDGKYAIENPSFITKCDNKRCKTCPQLSTSSVVKSYVTKREYRCINHENNHASCSTQNLIYLLTCQQCGIQYVGETTTRLNIRMNGHRTSKAGCEHVIKHKKACEGCIFSYQIIENLQGTGYDEIGSIDPDASKNRHTREDFWIKKLRTLFPYGLNEKAFDKVCDANDNSTAVGKIFPPLDRKADRPLRSRPKYNNQLDFSLEYFFSEVNKWFLHDKFNLFNNIRILLNKLPRQLLKAVASEILHPDQHATDSKKEHTYLFILDIIDTKLLPKSKVFKKSKPCPKNTCSIHFVNKGIDHLHLPSIFRKPNIVACLPDVLKEEENLPTVITRQDAPIRSKILNYKAVVSNLNLVCENGKYVVQDLPDCDCHTSEFCDDHHGHIVTGDLRVIQNNKLRSLISKGPNFREPRFLNFDKCLNTIKSNVKEFADQMIDKYKLKKDSLNDWTNNIIEQVKRKISVLKTKVKRHPVKPILKDPTVINYLEELHSKFVLVPIDKASKNIAIVCKKFYICRLMQELGISDSPSNTYQLSSSVSENIISLNVELCKSYDLEVIEKHKTLPIMYWTPKMHYTPSRARFIVASSSCSTKPMSKAVSIIFKKVQSQIQSFHEKAIFYANYNRFWVIQNSKPVLERLQDLNKKQRVKSISTFDFSTLYTKLPHKNLVEVLNSLIEFVFNGGRKTPDGNRKFISIKGNSCFFSRTKQETSFTKEQVKMMVDHLVTQAFFTFGNLVFLQTIGIPMGIDPAPFWANLYLYHYESRFITHLSKTDRYRGFKFRNCFRFIDDACSINDSDEFSNSYGDIYPKDLQLKCEHKGTQATFLELDITIKDGVFSYKLYDKRDAFPFHIVRMPDISGNIPNHVFYGSVYSELLRIARATLSYEDFLNKAKILIQRMLKQGGLLHNIIKCIDKLYDRHSDAFLSFNKPSSEVKNDLTKV